MVLFYGDERAIRHAGESARTTHGSPIAVEYTERFARLLLDALNGSVDLRWTEPVRGSGYIVESLNAALWAVDTTDDFESAILAAVNLGDDADTTAAIAGQLAGALYGVDAIPAHWRERVFLRDEILELADRLAA